MSTPQPLRPNRKERRTLLFRIIWAILILVVVSRVGVGNWLRLLTTLGLREALRSIFGSSPLFGNVEAAIRSGGLSLLRDPAAVRADTPPPSESLRGLLRSGGVSALAPTGPQSS
jgi:hypothetical protein